MTSMKRTSVSLPEDLVARIFELRKTDSFTRYSYSELIRMLAKRGLDVVEAENGTSEPAEQPSDGERRDSA